MENPNDPIDFRKIPISIKLLLARRKVIALSSQIDILESINKEQNKKIWDLQEKNREFIKSNMELHKKVQELEEKAKEYDRLEKPSKKERQEIRRTSLYKEMGLMIKAKSEKIKRLEKRNRELTELIIQRSRT
jgi:uncharacterized protein YlxW (UPF0749 family)